MGLCGPDLSLSLLITHWHSLAVTVLKVMLKSFSQGFQDSLGLGCQKYVGGDKVSSFRPDNSWGPAKTLPLSECNTLWPDSFRYSTWGGFNILILNLFIWRYMGFWFQKVIQQYTEITTQTQYSNCNIQLNHNTNGIHIATLCMLTVKMLGIPSCWEGIYELKPTQACCSLWSSFFWVFNFYTLCWAEPHIHFPHVGLAGSGR